MVYGCMRDALSDYDSIENEREEPLKKVQYVKKLSHSSPPPNMGKQSFRETDFSSSPPPKSKRLKFKRKTKQNDSKPETFSHSEISPPPQPRKSSSKAKVKEWGPSVNGYRFLCVDTPEEHKFATGFFKHSIFYGVNDIVRETSSPSQPEEYSYEVYLSRWQDPDDSRINWPNAANDPSSISVGSVKDFFPADDSVLKRERIRWHPDKMQRFVRGVVGKNEIEKTLEYVTSTFQVVNHLWEGL